MTSLWSWCAGCERPPLERRANRLQGRAGAVIGLGAVLILFALPLNGLYAASLAWPGFFPVDWLGFIRAASHEAPSPVDAP